MELESALRGVLPDQAQVNAGPSARDLHARDASFHAPVRPDVVVFPASTDEVSQVMAIAERFEVAVTPWGTGSSLEGNAIPVRGGISIDLSRMDRILDVDPVARTATVQAGVTRLALERRVGPEGLSFTVDPGADASLGGMAATNAAGTTSLRFGTMRRNVRALEAVLPGGRRIRTGTQAAKTSAGYGLTGLLVGSEGTLAVICELVLDLHPIDEATAAFQLSFASLEAAGAACATMVAYGLPLLRLELLDAWEVRALNAFRGTGLPEGSLVLGDLTGSEEGVAAALAELEALVPEVGGEGLRVERDRDAQRALWRARHDIYFAELHAAPGKQGLTTDVCVPLSALASTLAVTRAAVDSSGLTGGISAHAGDGNIHVGLMVDPADSAEMGRVEGLLDRLVDAALSCGGTCTGEHGIGLGKLGFLEREHGDLIELMRGIKLSFDPKGIMNPGKVLRS